MKTKINGSSGYALKTLRAVTLAFLMVAMANLSGAFNVFADSSKKTTFSGEQVFRGVNFGDGPVAKLFPEVWKSSDVEQQLGDEKRVAAFNILREKVVSQINLSDPTFMDRYGREMQSGEHLRIQKALEESSLKITNAMQVIGTMNEKGEIGNNYAEPELACSAVAVCVAAVAVAVWKWVAVVDIAAVAVVAAVAVAIWRYVGIEDEENIAKGRLFREQFVNSVAERLDAE